MTKLERTIAAIDAANSLDPREIDGHPEALLYGQRMSTQVERLFPDANDTLKIAARGQHIERWILQRAAYPAGRIGYLTWRKELAAHHSARVCELMTAAGYDSEDVNTVGRMIRKEGLKRDADVQALEDVICFTFLTWYFAPFAAKHSPEKIQRIVEKTARKMSADASARVLKEFDLPSDLAAAFQSK
nr:DUF4202 domain-containing protein [uncultured Shimia sp.]